jgi:hypothetical protein
MTRFAVRIGAVQQVPARGNRPSAGHLGHHPGLAAAAAPRYPPRATSAVQDEPAIGVEVLKESLDVSYETGAELADFGKPGTFPVWRTSEVVDHGAEGPKCAPERCWQVSPAQHS